MSNDFARNLAGYVFLTQVEELLLSEASACIGSVEAGRDLIKEGDKPGHTIVVLEGWAFRYNLRPGRLTPGLGVFGAWRLLSF